MICHLNGIINFSSNFTVVREINVKVVFSVTEIMIFITLLAIF